MSLDNMGIKPGHSIGFGDAFKFAGVKTPSGIQRPGDVATPGGVPMTGEVATPGGAPVAGGVPGSQEVSSPVALRPVDKVYPALPPPGRLVHGEPVERAAAAPGR
ncbi:hypothetical protein ACFYS8_14880 [Kitasatospora sp. NPDC004615]|uniref:hypothetical protein n=1 Tax=Kitasatospora sp. NPDC004615 TaxID=3364017 RepID=UPI0036B33A49